MGPVRDMYASSVKLQGRGSSFRSLVWYSGTVPSSWITSACYWAHIQMVGLCAMSYVLDRPVKYQARRKQDGIHLSGIKMVGLSGIQIPTVMLIEA